MHIEFIQNLIKPHQSFSLENHPEIGPILKIERDNQSAKICLYGAHLLSWKVAGTERLFLSERSAYQYGQPIRGGVPLVFPQFGMGQLPSHGFFRIVNWSLKQVDVDSQSTSLTLELNNTEETEKIWPYSFHAQITLKLFSSRLIQELTFKNLSDSEIQFQNAFHTYFAVDNSQNVCVAGLKGKTYLDSTKNREKGSENNETILLNGNVDRIYLEAPAQVLIQDLQKKSLYSIRHRSATDIVVWNPGAERCASIPDLSPDDYLKYVCVEAGNVINPVKVAAGQSWTGSQDLEVLDNK